MAPIRRKPQTRQPTSTASSAPAWPCAMDTAKLPTPLPTETGQTIGCLATSSPTTSTRTGAPSEPLRLSVEEPKRPYQTRFNRMSATQGLSSTVTPILTTSRSSGDHSPQRMEISPETTELGSPRPARTNWQYDGWKRQRLTYLLRTGRLEDRLGDEPATERNARLLAWCQIRRAATRLRQSFDETRSVCRTLRVRLETTLEDCRHVADQSVLELSAFTPREFLGPRNTDDFVYPDSDSDPGEITLAVPVNLRAPPPTPNPIPPPSTMEAPRPLPVPPPGLNPFLTTAHGTTIQGHHPEAPTQPMLCGHSEFQHRTHHGMSCCPFYMCPHCDRVAPGHTLEECVIANPLVPN